MSTRTRFEKEAKGNSEMAYLRQFVLLAFYNTVHIFSLFSDWLITFAANYSGHLLDFIFHHLRQNCVRLTRAPLYDSVTHSLSMLSKQTIL